MSSNSLVQRAGFGPLEGQEFVVALNATLGTTAVEITAQTQFLAALAAYPNATLWRVKIFNPSSSVLLAWQTTGPAAVSSTATADFASTAGSHVGRNDGDDRFVMQGAVAGVQGRKLWLVAGAAGSSASVTFSPIT